MIIYGVHPVLELLRSDLTLVRVLVERGKEEGSAKRVLQLAQSRGVPVDAVPAMARICGNVVHQSICAEFDENKLVRDMSEPLTAPRAVMLDGIQDPHNFGAALRVCDSFGFTDIIFHKGNSSGLTPAAVKVSAGAAFHLRLYQSNLNLAARRLKDQGYALLVLDGDGETDLYDLELPARYCVVAGSEDRGVRFILKRQADAVVRIPMQGKVNSLNVSCALTAMLTECARQSRQRGSSLESAAAGG